MVTLDEHFEYFLKIFGPAIDRQEVPLSSIDRYKTLLPQQLLQYWTDHGWSGYADGLLWTVKPEHLIHHWLQSTSIAEEDHYHVIARSAFGLLYVWGEKGGQCLSINSCLAHYHARASIFASRQDLDLGVKAFFASCSPEDNDLGDLFQASL